MDSDNSNQETLDRSVYHPDKKHAKNNFRGFGDVMDRTVHYSPKADNENKSFKTREENYQADNLPTTLNSVRNETIKKHEELDVVSNLSDNAEIHNVKTKKLSQEKSMSLSENGSDFVSQIVSSDLLPPTDDFNVIPSIASSEVNQQKANSDVNQSASSDVYLQTTNCDVDQLAATSDVYPKTSSSVVYLQRVSSDEFKPTSSSDVYLSKGNSDVNQSIVSTDVHQPTANSDVSPPTANSDVRPPIASTDVHQLTASSDEIPRYIPCLTFQ